MSFQWIINSAESISIDKQEIVGQSITRNQTVRTVSRGGNIWKFTVKLPDGLPWTEYRQNIAASEKLGKITASSINLNHTGHEWMVPYQGNSINYTGFRASITTGLSSITLTTSPTTSSGYKFRAGDYIQLGSGGHVYMVTSDVVYSSNTVNLHRAVIDDTASNVALLVGPNVSWSVVCTEFPQWNLFSRDQVSWSGPFVFYESMV